VSTRKCADCGAPIQQKPMGGPRKYCEDCRPSAPKPTASPQLVAVNAAPVAGQVYDRTLEVLRQAEREATPLGAVALTLAEQMDSGGHAATGYAALAKQLEATLASAMAGVKLTVSAVDELRARRERRRA